MPLPDRQLAAWKRGWLACCLFALCGAGVAAPGPMDFLFTTGVVPVADAAKANRRAWKVGEYSAVRVVPREAGSPANQHPLQLQPERLRSELAAIEVSPRSGDTQPLFAPDELAELVPALVAALASAGPTDDVLLLSTSRRSLGLLSLPQSATARLFAQDGALQLIVHHARLDVVGPFRMTHVVPDLAYGSRSADSGTKLRSASAPSRRGDWVALSLMAAAAEAAPAAAAASKAPSAAPAPATAGQPRGAPFYEEQEQRLRGLKRLRDQGLITEDEYQQKRREILQSL